MPSVEFSSSEGARFSRNARGLESQCDALCSSPKAATACATTGTMREMGNWGAVNSCIPSFRLTEGKALIAVERNRHGLAVGNVSRD